MYANAMISGFYGAMAWLIFGFFDATLCTIQRGARAGGADKL